MIIVTDGIPGLLGGTGRNFPTSAFSIALLPCQTPLLAVAHAAPTTPAGSELHPLQGSAVSCPEGLPQSGRSVRHLFSE